MPFALTQPRRALRVVVLASGEGSNLQALLDEQRSPSHESSPFSASETTEPGGFSVVAVGSDRPQASALLRAEAAGVDTFVVPLGDFPDRTAWDRALAAAVAVHEPDLVLLAGFMKLVGADFLGAFENRVWNTHPALCPAFPGTSGPADALAYGVKVTGATLFVVDDGVDTGPIVAQVAVPVAEDDDVPALHERIKVAERQMLVDAVKRLAAEGFSINDRKVRFGCDR